MEDKKMVNLTDFNLNVSFEAGKTLKDCNELIEAINNNCDVINFSRIPLMYKYNSDLSQFEIYTTYEYIQALHYLLLDMYWN